MQFANLMQLAARDPDSNLVRVVIDTPRGSRNKYKFDEQLALFKLSRVLPAGMSFPYDFGSIPGTCAEDGDALDVLVLAESPLVVGCLVLVHLIGVIRAQQTESGKTIRNDRLIAVLETTVNKPTLRDLQELPDQHVQDIEHFFRSYNQAQGRPFRITGRGGPEVAEQMLSRAERSSRHTTKAAGGTRSQREPFASKEVQRGMKRSGKNK
jgi:inorganic pyrophosphatase